MEGFGHKWTDRSKPNVKIKMMSPSLSVISVHKENFAIKSSLFVTIEKKTTSVNEIGKSLIKSNILSAVCVR